MKAIVPPPGTVGTRLATRSRRTIRTPGIWGPPMSLCGEKKTASLWSPASVALAAIRMGR
jgi:hypothetical protein